MGTIAKINGVTWTSVAKVNGIAVAGIAKVDGMDKPSGTSISYIIDETFEGDTSAWTAEDGTTGGIADLAYTTSPLVGSYSARVKEGASSGDCYLSRSLGGNRPTLSLKLQMQVRGWFTSNLTERLFVNWYNGTTPLGGINIDASGTQNQFGIRVGIAGGTGTTTSAKFGLNTTVWMWLDWSVATDTASCYWNDSDSKPTGDSTKTSTRSAAATTEAQTIRLTSDAPGNDFIFDNVQVWVP